MNMRDKMIRVMLKKQREGEYENFFKHLEKVGHQEADRLLAGLYNGLDPEATLHLQKILATRQKLYKEDVCSYNELYDCEQLEDMKKLNKFRSEIVKTHNGWRYGNYNLPIKHFDPSVFLYEHGMQRIKNLDSLLGKDIVDAGGFIADSALVFCQKTKCRKVYSFEPNAKNYELGEQTIAMNSWVGDRIVHEKLALGDRDSECILVQNGGSSYILHDTLHTSGERVQTTSLDSYVMKHDLQVGLIKVDVEGFERYFLEGARETLKTQKPILLLSIYHNFDDFFRLKPLLEEMKIGYKFDFFKGTTESVWSEILLLCEIC